MRTDILFGGTTCGEFDLVTVIFGNSFWNLWANFKKTQHCSSRKQMRSHTDTMTHHPWWARLRSLKHFLEIIWIINYASRKTLFWNCSIKVNSFIICKFDSLLPYKTFIIKKAILLYWSKFIKLQIENM